MKMDKVAGSQNDEFYTPKFAVKPIIKYLKQQSFIWCPFDTKESNYAKLLTEAGHNVLCTHIDNGVNFFDYKINNDIDYIISNPPYSLKTEVLQRLFEINIPFAMLVGVVGLFESQKRFDMFKNNKFEIMYFNKRVSYMKDYMSNKLELNPPFSSVYVCHNILPQQIVFEEINKKEI
jgi:hypothetical protein